MSKTELSNLQKIKRTQNPRNTRTTLRDVAAKANVATTTASAVLGKKEYCYASKETKQRIFQAAKELGYRPNQLGRGLRGGRTQTIGVLMGTFDTAINLFKLKAIEQAAREAGYVCYVSYLPCKATDAASDIVQEMLGRSVDGIIAYFSRSSEQTSMPELENADVPIVYLDGAPQGAKYHVKIDRTAGINQVADHLAGLGHKTIRYVSTTSDVYEPSLKADLYRKAMKRVGIEMLSPWEYVIDPKLEVTDSVYQLIKKMVDANDLPTALVMNNDDGALAAIAALQDMGINVPDVVSIIGFDDVLQAKYYRPALTTIHQPREEAGVAAFEILHDAMQAQDSFAESEPVCHSFDCQLIVRQSTGTALQTSKTNTSLTPDLKRTIS